MRTDLLGITVSQRMGAVTSLRWRGGLMRPAATRVQPAAGGTEGPRSASAVAGGVAAAARKRFLAFTDIATQIH